MAVDVQAAAQARLQELELPDLSARKLVGEVIEEVDLHVRTRTFDESSRSLGLTLKKASAVFDPADGQRPAKKHNNDGIVYVDSSQRGHEVTGGKHFAVRFEHCEFDEAKFFGCVFEHVVFERCTFTRSVWHNVVLRDVRFNGCTFVDLLWTNERRVEQNFEDEYYSNDTVDEANTPPEIEDPDLLQYDPKCAEQLLCIRRAGATQVDTSDEERFLDAEDTDMQSSMVSNLEASSLSFPTADARWTLWPPLLFSNAFMPPGPDFVSRSRNSQLLYNLQQMRQALARQSQGKARITEVADVSDASTNAQADAPKTRNAPYQPRHSYAISPTARNIAWTGCFPFLDLPLELREKIYGQLLAPSVLRIVDANHEYDGQLAQLHYDLAENIDGGRFRGWKATYIACSDANETAATEIQTSIMRTCRQVEQEAASVLYGQHTFLHCSAEGALSWLHDCSQYLQHVKSLVFEYRFKDNARYLGPRLGRIVFTETSGYAFRLFCNTLVHKCEGLTYFGLKIGGEFWREHRYWRKGARVVLEHVECLQRVARLADYNAAIAQRHGHNSGVHLQLHIERTESPDKERFVHELEQLIHEKRVERPRIAYEGRTCIGCRGRRTKEYEHCCFVKLPVKEWVKKGIAGR